MAQTKDSKRAPPRREYEIAYYTKELGRDVQRQLLRERLAEFIDKDPLPPAAHGEDVQPVATDAPPQEDRAG